MAEENGAPELTRSTEKLTAVDDLGTDNQATEAESEQDGLTIDVLPDSQDASVQSEAGRLRDKFELHQLILTFSVIGRYLHLTNLAMAKEEALLKTVQNAMFSTLKVCDAASLMLQTFQSSANNMLEKLKIAYIYLRDGFEDFARTDVEATKKDVETMRNQVENTSRVLLTNKDEVVIGAEEVKRKLDQLQEELDREEEKQQRKNNLSVNESGKETRRSGRTGGCKGLCACLCPCLFPSRYTQVEEVSSGDVETQQEHEDPQLKRAKKKQLYLLKLTAASLDEVIKSFGDCEGMLDNLMPIVEGWRKKCVDVLEPADEGLNEEQKKAYWNSVMFKTEVMGYYTRWRALQVYAEGLRKNSKDTRKNVEEKYTENPSPSEAEVLAWKLAEQDNRPEIQTIAREHKNLNIEAVGLSHSGYQNNV